MWDVMQGEDFGPQGEVKCVLQVLGQEDHPGVGRHRGHGRRHVQECFHRRGVRHVSGDRLHIRELRTSASRRRRGEAGRGAPSAG